MSNLLSRNDFRNGVFKRDKSCVICHSNGVDAHHILERRLFPDGGYYLENGALLCQNCHLLAEETIISCEDIRSAIGIKNVILPPHLYPDQRYDKWGNPILENGQRLQGELFNDHSVQKILRKILHLFTKKVKYPRTFHLPFSPSVSNDDRIMSNINTLLSNEVVITEKMDGENTSLYQNYIHARSIDYIKHPSRGWIRAFHSNIKHQIPEGWRVCGENLFSKHSIEYANLSNYFLGFSIWDGTNCLSWDETVEWFELLGIDCVPVLYRGKLSQPVINEIISSLDFNKQEGFVIRTTSSFSLKDFSTHVGKYVRANHVSTHGHWMRNIVVKNKLRGEYEN